jgi:beta-mannosidase
VLNGTPIFAKGADWIPAHSFVGAIPDQRYAMLLESARDAHMNMLRVWGGGIYESEAFYDLCDQLGLLVWQDFMFACAMYPEHDQWFAAEVAAEATYQVRRLRSRASLALWCGNNENQWIHDRTFWDQPDYPVPGSLYYNHTLPVAVATHDGYTPYWPGSPYGGNDYTSYEDGNRHNWDVWHGQYPRRFGEKPYSENTPESVSFRRYAEDMGRFISEFGMHASPVMETLRRVIPEDQRYHHSPSMDHHNKDNPKNKGDMLMLGVTGLPETLEDYIDFSMIAQAEGLKFGIEHFRRRMPHCSGTLVWQLNDCWPVLSWSVMDYNGFGKAGYYYLKRVFSPVLASFKELSDGALELWITNDTGDSLNDEVAIQLTTFNGDSTRRESVTVNIPARSSRAVKHWSCAELVTGPNRYLWVESTAHRFPANRHFFAAIKDLQRPPAQVNMHITQVDEHHLRVELSTDHFAYFVHLSSPDAATHFDDNFIDLPAGSRRTISLTNRTAVLTPEMIEVRWR